MRLFLGVDGGQSSTTALIGGESGCVLGAGSGGPCNHVGAAEGRAKFTQAITECVGAACAQAGLDAGRIRFEAACFGMSGGPADKQAILAQVLAVDRLVVTDDARIALTGATAGEPGVITIAGTGSIAFGRNAAGRCARVGGWGYVFGDEGGGFDLTRQALRAALRYEEGWGPATALHRLLLDQTGAADVNDLLHRFYTEEFPRPRIATFAKLVDQAGNDGDPAAIEILHNAAQQLAALAASVQRQLWGPDEPARVAYIGGVFRSRRLLERFRTLVELGGSRCGPPIHGPAAGALLEAYRAVGLYPSLTNVPEFKL
ncbi:MAG: ATPase [Acidobacteria bacterium]|nr:ATPase [Acidobacteriota bacterium]